MSDTHTDIINKYQSIAPKNVTNAIKQASAKTGVSFAYLMDKAATESAFDTKAEAKTSSAKGLYQFIDQTWLGTVQKNGFKHGLGHLAHHITQDNTGKLTVSDPKIKQDIMALREDPKTSALMAAEFALDNKQHLENKLDRDITTTDMYIAHFMGASGASQFLSAQNTNPEQTAKDLFPTAAKANKAVFFDKTTGKPRTLQQVYDFFDKKFTPDKKTPPSVIHREVSTAENTKLPAMKPSINTLSPEIDLDETYKYVSASNSYSPIPSVRKIVSPVTVMMMSEMVSSFTDIVLRETDKDKNRDNNQDDKSWI